MKTNTVIAASITLLVGGSIVALSSQAQAGERYKHHCSTDMLKPTVLQIAQPLRPAHAAVETRRYYPGVNAMTKVIVLNGGRRVIETRFMKGDTFKHCYFRNLNWTADIKKKK